MKSLQSLELNNNTPTKQQVHRKWKHVVQELSDLNLTLADLDPMTSEKPRLAMELCRKNNVTMGEMVLLRQYMRAIEEGDTRAAEFLRDTMGENPKQVVEVQKSTLSKMSEEELEKALNDLNSLENNADSDK